MTAVHGQTSQAMDPSVSDRSVAGVCLEPEAGSVAFSAEHGDEGDKGDKREHRWIKGQSAVPPATVLATFAGEAVEAQVGWPMDPRGCGDVWPANSRMNLGQRAARFPVGYAWNLLRRGEAWTYRNGAFSCSVGAEQALAKVVRALVGQQETSGEIALVTPVDLTDDAFGVLATGLWNELGSRVSMIARPVAAVGALMMMADDDWDGGRDAHPTGLGKQGHGGRDAHPTGKGGKVLALHLGLAEWDARVVEVIARDGDRNRGAAELVLRSDAHWPAAPGSYGLDLLGRLAARSLEMSYRAATPTRVWELMWCTPWMNVVIDRLCGLADRLVNGLADGPADALVGLSAHALSTEFMRQQWRQATQQILSGSPSPTGFVVEDLPVSPRLEDLRDWVSALRARLGGEEITGVVVTGAMAGVVDRETGALGEHYAKRIVPGVKWVALEGRELRRGCLAAAAGGLVC